MAESEALELLVADGFLRREPGRCVPAPRWHAAVARAALTLQARGGDLEDLRLPIAWALSEAYGASQSDEALAEMVGVMLPFTALVPKPR